MLHFEDAVEASETDDGLAIKGRFDRDTELGKSDYRNTEGRKVSVLSIGYAGHELTDLDLIEVPIDHHLIWRLQGYDIRLPGRFAIARYG